jgi:hypothetical protein
MDADSFNKLAARFASDHGREDVKALYDGIISRRELAPVRSDPSTAVALLQNYDMIGLSLGRAAQALDVILGEVPTEARPGDLLSDNLTQRRITDLLEHLEGSFSTTAYVANPDNVLSAIRSALAAEASKPEEDRRPFHPVVLSWAHRLRERPDFPEMLQGSINRFSFREWVMIAVWAAENFPVIAIDPEEVTEPIPVARFAYFGIDESVYGPDVSFPLDMYLELQDLIDEYRQGEFAPETVEDELASFAEPGAETTARPYAPEDDLGIALDGEAEEDLDPDEDSGEAL